jgi:hypothetical protein
MNIKDFESLIQEHKSLERNLEEARSHEFARFQNSLGLDQLGIHSIDALHSHSDRPGLPLGQKLTPRSDEGDPEHIPPLKRTNSTKTLKDKTPEQKWKGLMKMYREHNHEKKVKEARTIMSKATREADNKEKIKLRSAIISLARRKNLSHEEEQTLADLRLHLKELENHNNMQSRNRSSSVNSDTN